MIKVDTTAWKTAVRNYSAVSKRKLPDIINKSAGYVALYAARLTKRASIADMDRDLVAAKIDRMKMVRPAKPPHVIKSGKRKGKMTVAKPPKWKHILRFKPTALAVKIIHKKGFHGTQEESNLKAERLIMNRHRSKGYIASGWIPAIRALLIKAESAPEKKRRIVGPGGSIKATPKQLTAVIINDTPAANTIGASALQSALDQEAEGFKQQLVKRMKEIGAAVNYNRPVKP